MQKFETMPEGWKLDKTTGSPVTGYDVCTNGISRLLPGHRSGLVRAARARPIEQPAHPVSGKPPAVEREAVPADAKTINTLARKKMIERLLTDVRVDLEICALEGWDKTEYISELRELLAALGRS